MKHGEAPWFLMWLSALLFAFGMVWAWLVDIGVAMTVTVLDTPERSAILVGAGALGILLAEFSMFLAWRRYARAMKDAPICVTGSEIVGRAGRPNPSATTTEARHPEAPDSP